MREVENKSPDANAYASASASASASARVRASVCENWEFELPNLSSPSIQMWKDLISASISKKCLPSPIGKEDSSPSHPIPV